MKTNLTRLLAGLTSTAALSSAAFAELDPLPGGAADISPVSYNFSIDYDKDGDVDDGDLARAAQNPVADMISLPFQNNFLFTEDDNDLIWVMNVQPVIPFSIEPSMVALTMRGPWVFGALASNIWSVAGDSNRSSVNQLQFLFPQGN
jgi:hypothetical protein